MKLDVDAFEDHQVRNLALLSAVVGGLEAGMKEADVRRLAEDKRSEHGFDRWFHAPHVRIGPKRSKLGMFATGRDLARGDLVHVDVAGGSQHAFGDAGTTVAFDAEEPEVLARGRALLQATCGYASHWKVVGELFVFARAWAANRQLQLASRGAIGHICLGPAGALAAGYPRSAHAVAVLRRNQVRMLNPRRLRGVWALQIPVTDGTRVVEFEELIAVDDTQRRVLGRAGPDDAGWLVDA